MRRCAVIFLLATHLPAAATQHWTVGGTEHPWSVWGVSEAVDAAAEFGWIQPIRTTPDQNLALGNEQRVTRAYSLQPSIQSLGGVESMVDGDSTTAFEMTLEATVGSSVILDLGAVFPVHLVRFYPRQDELHHERFLRAYQVYVTDRTLSPEGQILWDLVAPNWENDDSIVNISIPNQYVRDVRIQAVTNLQWEVAEWEVYGQGFAPVATYTTEPIDLGGPANFGALTWAAEHDPAGTVTLATRTGTDSSPFTYYRLVRPEEGVVDTVEVTRSAYEALGEADRWLSFDAVNWSYWSAPYAPSGREEIVSPAPRRYLQVQLQFRSTAFTDRAKVDSVTIEYSSPPVAQRVIAEVSPGLVEAGKLTTFTYAVTPTIRPGDTGFDALTVQTPLAARVRELRVAGVPQEFQAEVTDQAFTVRFPLVRTDGARLELTFDAQVLIYGTLFSGTVFDSRGQDLPQEVVEGDASAELSTNRLSVGLLELGEEVLAGVAVDPAVFSPNGDGVNDRVAIGYDLKKLLLPGRVTLAVYTVNGARVWSRSTLQASGSYAEEWDGRDAHGRLVAPGSYVCLLTVDTASGSEAKARVVRVAY
ncbi:MAG: gliding motility-associated C-terminal domain-containing protein [Candidatus Latescibacterota bacterium]|jgi:hypothetical protein